MALGVKAGVAAAVSYHSLTAAPIYQNLIVRTRTALPVTDRLAALESAAGPTACGTRSGETSYLASYTVDRAVDQACGDHPVRKMTERRNDAKSGVGGRARSMYRLGSSARVIAIGTQASNRLRASRASRKHQASRQLRTAGVGSFSKFLWGATSVSGRSCSDPSGHTPLL